MAITAVLDLGPDDRVVLKSPYDPALVEALKMAIPWAYREWDAAAKVWRIDAAWEDVLLHVLECTHITVVDKRPRLPLPAPAPPALSEACTRLYVTPDAPVPVAEAAYKALARLYHPDVGGDVQLMQALNDAIQTFKSYAEVS